MLVEQRKVSAINIRMLFRFCACLALILVVNHIFKTAFYIHLDSSKDLKHSHDPAVAHSAINKMPVHFVTLSVIVKSNINISIVSNVSISNGNEKNLCIVLKKESILLL